MKKRLFLIVLSFVLMLSGCSKSSDRFFSYKDHISNAKISIGIELSENPFFAEKIVVIPESGFDAGDDLVGAEAAFLCDATNKEALYAKSPYKRLYPASLTKLMTALIVLRKGALTDSVTISYNASHITVPGAKVCGFEEGDVISMEALLNCLLIYSGNDAGIAIAEHMSGTEEEFVKLMNAEAKKLGASHTNFTNSHGLHDDNHYTTVYDVYLIFNELIQYDTFLNIINQSSYTAVYKDRNKNEKQMTFNTTNLYLRGDKQAPEGITVIGGKTGVTYRAGNCLVLLTRDENNTEYISIIMKAGDADSLYSDMSALLSLVTKNNGTE